MKNITSIIFILLFSVNVFAGNLKAYFTYCTFNSPTDGPYIETYLSVIGGSAIYGKTAQNTFQGKIEVTLIFKQGEEVKTFKKYNLLSPEITDSLSERVNFMDQQRIPLPNGDYEFEVLIKDLNSSNPPFNYTQPLSINFLPNQISISDVELIESITKSSENTILTKSGYDIIPYTSDFYSEEFEKIAFYTEIYNADKLLGKNQDFLISYFIESYEGNQVVRDYKSFAKEKAKPVNILLKSFPIEKLPSGNYNLVIEARNKNNELLTSKKVFFQRSNPKVSPLLMSDEFQSSFVSKYTKSQLTEFIKCIEPKSTSIEVEFAKNQLQSGDIELMRQYFYNFWLKRNSKDPEAEWEKYLKEVKKVNDLFYTQIKKGYVTDRGIIYLKYGKPNTRTVFPEEPASFPYEIWHYYEIEGFSNKKFVFYNPSRGINEFPLLHSDFPGYILDKQWRLQLNKRTGQPNDHDSESPFFKYEDKSGDYFNNPR